MFKYGVFAIGALALSINVAVAGDDPTFDSTDLGAALENAPVGATFECRKFQRFAMHTRKDPIEFDCVLRDGSVAHFALESQYGRSLTRAARAKDLYSQLFDIKRIAIMNVVLTFSRSPNDCSLIIETFDRGSGDRLFLAGVELVCNRK